MHSQSIAPPRHTQLSHSDLTLLPVSSLPKTFVEYFAGIGLTRMALESEGWNVVFANDFSPKKFAMYQGFYPSSSGHYAVGDIFGLDYSSIPPSTLATCSFPCIDLSLAGNLAGINGEHSSAFWGFIEALRSQGAAAPPLVLVENVLGWLSSNEGSDFRATVTALNDVGYSCDVFLLDARRFTPQSRPRVFLVGVRSPALGGDPLRILERSSALSSRRLRTAILASKDLDWTYLDIPEPPPFHKGGLNAILESVSPEAWWSSIEVLRH